MSEQKFEYRIQKILEQKGYLVINCARSKPFDLIAIKDSRAFPIECKGLRLVRTNNKLYKYLGRYTDEQRDQQILIAQNARTNFYLIRQSKKRGKIHLDMLSHSSGRFTSGWSGVLYEDLKELFQN